MAPQSNWGAISKSAVLSGLFFIAQQAWAAPDTPGETASAANVQAVEIPAPGGDIFAQPGTQSQDESGVKIAEVGLDAALRFGATKEPLSDVLNKNGDAGLGMALRFEDMLYRGGSVRNDLLPFYLYEGDFFYLQAYRVGVKLLPESKKRFDVFLTHRFEGYPYDVTPPILAGMAMRRAGVDAGFCYQWQGDWGNYFGEYLHDVSGASMGNEFQLGYSYDRRTDGLMLTPSLVFAARDDKLNDYYYGVRPSEATPFRPAYKAGAGINIRIGIDARYDLTKHWRLVGGVFSTHWSDMVRYSPIVESRVQIGSFVGLDYDFEPAKRPFQATDPLIIKVLHGKATDCNFLPIIELSCTSTRTVDHTSVDGLELGKSFVDNFNGWPLDFVGYIALLHHDERGLQPDSWQFNGYMKAYFHGFPWEEHVHTRLGFGVGLSYAQRVPYVEERDLVRRGRNTSRLLNYLDPSIDVSLGDIFGIRSQHDTYFGLGVTHRSGIFGTAQVLGNVNGGSNYIYSYIEWRI